MKSYQNLNNPTLLRQMSRYQNQKFSTTETFAIPQTMVGRVIGKGAQNLKTIQQKVHGCKLFYDNNQQCMKIHAKDFRTAELVKKYLTQIINTIKKRQREYEVRKTEIAKRQDLWVKANKLQNTSNQGKSNAQHLLRFQSSGGSIRGLKSDRYSMRRFDDRIQCLYDAHKTKNQKTGKYSLSFSVFRERTIPMLVKEEATAFGSARIANTSKKTSSSIVDKSLSEWLKPLSPNKPISTGVWGQKMDVIKTVPQISSKKKGSTSLYNLSKSHEKATSPTSTASPTGNGGFLRKRQVSESEFWNRPSCSDEEFDFVDEEDFDFGEEIDLTKETLDKQHRIRNTIGFDEETIDDWETHWSADLNDTDSFSFA